MELVALQGSTPSERCVTKQSRRGTPSIRVHVPGDPVISPETLLDELRPWKRVTKIEVEARVEVHSQIIGIAVRWKNGSVPLNLRHDPVDFLSPGDEAHKH